MISASRFPEKPLLWYSLPFAYLFGLISNVYFIPALFCFLIIFFFCPKNRKVISTVIFFFLFGVMYGKPYTFKEEPAWFENNKKVEYTAYISGIQSLNDMRWRLILSNVTKVGESEPLPHDTVLYMYYEDADNAPAPPIKGMKINFYSAIKYINFTENSGIAPSRTFWNNKNIFYTTYLSMKKPQASWEKTDSLTYTFAELRNRLFLAYTELCKDKTGEISQAHALLIAVLFGEKFYLTTRTTNLFTEASLVHSIALSGMHLGFAVLLRAYGSPVELSLQKYWSLCFQTG